jgi:hypothetical protein
MPLPRLAVLNCIERERLEFELLEVRTRSQYLSRLRSLSPEEQSQWDRRERDAMAKLNDHDQEHGCSR